MLLLQRVSLRVVRTARAALCLLAAGALLVLAQGQAQARVDPIALQQQAIRRLDEMVAHFRQTGDFQSRRPDLARADAELTQSNRALAERGDWKNLALGLTKQGTVWRMQAQWPRAIGYYEQALQAAQRAGHAGYQADALSWKALAETSQNKHGQAFDDAQRALRLAESANDMDVLARALDVLATVQIAQRDLPGAADTLTREVEVAAQAADPMASFFAHLNRSDVYLKIAEKCDFQRSFEPCFKALDLSRANMQRGQDIARQLGYAGLVRQAEEMLVGIESRRALIKSRQGFDQTLGQAQIFRPRQASDVLVSERFIAPAGEMPAQMLAMLQESRRREQAAGGFAQGTEATSLYTEGLAHEMQGRNAAALAEYRKAVAALERDRRSLRDERSRGSFMENRINVYYAAVLQLLQQRRPAEAFDMLERSRSRALADLLASRQIDLQGGEEQRLYAELATLRARIANAQGRLFEMDGQTAGARALGARIEADEAGYRTLLERIATQAPKLADLVDSKPASLAALQASMRAEGYETLQYLVTESAVILWHITPDSVFVRNVFLPRGELMRKVAALAGSLRNADTPFDDATAGELFLFLIQPALQRLRSERLVIVPHEDLAGLPFQALRNPGNGRFFGERFQISYAPSATVLLGLRRSEALAGARVLAMADPGIRGAAQEVGTIGRLFPGRSQVQSEALPRENAVKSLVGGFDVLHLAVHGNFDAGEPMLSHLKLAAGGGDDGRLTAAEMFGLPLAKSRLVVLSACETGRAQTTHANEVLGMSRALLYAGAGALLLSQWQVNSEATGLWMQAFYDAARDKPPAEAARLASLQLKSGRATSHPFYWAPFTLLAR